MGGGNGNTEESTLFVGDDKEPVNLNMHVCVFQVTLVNIPTPSITIRTAKCTARSPTHYQGK